MVGAERYSQYTGYLETYEYAGNFQDERKAIELKISENYTVVVKDTWISAIDAIPYFISSEFNNNNLNRELNKAYVGFNIMGLDGGQKAISTGNWGSGAFNGNLEYKFLIQWLAASRAHRSIDYFSFANPMADDIPKIVKKYSELTVKQLMEILTKNSQKF
jgi:poly(ADP-ribose) glycohydrolase